MASKALKGGLAAAAILIAAGFIPIGGGAASAHADATTVRPMDLTAFEASAPDKPLELLFIHHSCGGQLLADKGAENEKASCVYVSHPNGGGMRSRLEKDGYLVHEASYGSAIGEDTDMFHWLPKFRAQYDKILRIDLNDTELPDGKTNRIVVFKSCYPNNRFESVGDSPGNAAGPELTVWNAKATMNDLRGELAKHPDVLFVYLTAPPNAPVVAATPAWKWLAKKVLGKPSSKELVAQKAKLARDFNRWVVSTDGWLKGYEHKNIVVFDYYDVLTGGDSNLSKYATGNGSDSHPGSDGNAKAAEAFVPFINRATRRAGLMTK